MRILFLTHRLPYAPNRGDRIRAHHMIRVLARAAEVHLVSVVHDEDEWSHRNDLREIVASTDVVRLSHVRNRLAAAIALPGRQPLTHVLLHSPAIYATLRRRIAETPPDVVLAYCSGMARYACEPILSRIPFVLDLVDVDSEKWRALAVGSSGVKRWIFQREAQRLHEFEKMAIRRAAATTVVSQRERALLEEVTGGLTATVVPNGIDVDSFAPPGPPDPAARVVFCGVFSYEPNERAALWFARDIWPGIVRIRPEARLLLVGKGPTRALRHLRTNPTVEVTGEVPDVRPYLWGSAVAIAPLKIARGLQNKVLEALAAGLPAVVTSAVAAGLPESVRQNVKVADTVEEFGAAVIKLLSSSPMERRELAREANLAALRWETQIAPLVGLLRNAALSRNHVAGEP